jgi:hypothetical protein
VADTFAERHVRFVNDMGDKESEQQRTRLRIAAQRLALPRDDLSFAMKLSSSHELPWQLL